MTNRWRTVFAAVVVGADQAEGSVLENGGAQGPVLLSERLVLLVAARFRDDGR